MVFSIAQQVVVIVEFKSGIDIYITQCKYLSEVFRFCNEID